MGWFMATELVPPEWWKAACQHMNHPLACVGTDNKFKWVNEAWCRLVGYSPAELYERTWQSITTTDDVGGDYDAVADVIGGTRLSYYLEKSYLRKDKTEVVVELTVHRFPLAPIEELACFVVEAVNKQHDHEIASLRAQLDIITQAVDDMERWKTEVLAEDLIFDCFLPYVKKNWFWFSTAGTIFLGFISMVIWLLEILLAAR